MDSLVSKTILTSNLVEENAEVKQFYADLPEEQRKCVSSLSKKLQEVLSENGKIKSKCAGLESLRLQIEQKLLEYDQKALLDEEQIIKQKNQI